MQSQQSPHAVGARKQTRLPATRSAQTAGNAYISYLTFIPGLARHSTLHRISDACTSEANDTGVMIYAPRPTKQQVLVAGYMNTKGNTQYPC